MLTHSNALEGPLGNEFIIIVFWYCSDWIILLFIWGKLYQVWIAHQWIFHHCSNLLDLMAFHSWPTDCFYTLRPKQNGCHFADDIFKCIFFSEIVWIPIKIPLKFVPKCPISNIQALVQIMAWSSPVDKPLSEAMMIKLMTHICVTRPQWIKILLMPW